MADSPLFLLGLGDPFLGGTSERRGPLDLVPEAAIAFGQRALSNTMLGEPIYTIRRDSDDAEQAFSSDGVTGNVDQAAILAFIGAGDGFVSTWNDQSGNANDFVQATAAFQGLWNANDAGTRPSVEGAFTYLAEADITLNGGITVFVVQFGNADYSTNGTGSLEMTLSVPIVAPFIYIEQEDGNSGAGGAYDNTGVSDVQFNLWEATAEFGASVMLVNGASLTQTDNYSFGAALEDIIGPLLLDVGVVSKIVELIIWPFALSVGQRLSVRQNIAAYYGITI